MDRNFIRSSRFASFGGRSLFPGETGFPANAVCTARKRTCSALFFLPPPNKRPGRSRDGFVSRRWGLACFDCSKDNIKPFGDTYYRFFFSFFFTVLGANKVSSVPLSRVSKQNNLIFFISGTLRGSEPLFSYVCHVVSSAGVHLNTQSK